ncbi:MAG: leucine-rich repeat protein, partial [Muribaculaceae bacterium]|nr:leucine-rich repeat protein [Muribaculaceae bacterium]
MEYPLISEYREAILSAEENLSELSSLRPVLDNYGDPVMSSGNFAVVFKMKDERDGRLYALKCFIKDQEGREESYQKIADELETVSSTYILPLRYLDKELFVDTAHCQEEEFPVVVMEWVEGETLEAYLKRNLHDSFELEMLSYRFNRMAAWLLAQPYAHGDLKPDNILVRKDGSLVLVDYDGMFVPAMKGEKARETGSPDYRHPLRNESDFNEYIDDFSISVIALSLKAIALSPELKSNSSLSGGDSLLLTEQDFRQPGQSRMLQNIQQLSSNPDLAVLLGVFYIAQAKSTLESLSFRLFMTDRPKRPVTVEPQYSIDTTVTKEDIENGVKDEYGVIYSGDGKRLLKCPKGVSEYTVKSGTMVICDKAFYFCKSLQNITLPDSLTAIGDEAFSGCNSLQSIKLPSSLTAIGDEAFFGCESLQSITLPDSLTSIGVHPFEECCDLSLQISTKSQYRVIDNLLIDKTGRLISCLNRSKVIVLPDSVTAIGDSAFSDCKSLQSITLPSSLTAIGDWAFSFCKSLQSITLPSSLTAIGNNAFCFCESLQRITLP